MIRVGLSSAKVYAANVTWSIGPGIKTSAAIDGNIIDIRRFRSLLGPFVGYYASEEDIVEGNAAVLDIWDRESFREAYRHARIWRIGGIGRRVLACRAGCPHSRIGR